MGIYEFDQEVYERVLREDSEAIGIQKGIQIGQSQGIKIGQSQGIKIGQSQGIKIGQRQGIEIGKDRIFRIYRELQKGGTDDKMIAESCGCTAEEVAAAREQFGI